MSLVSERKDGVDMVNHPPHYADVIPGVECIEIARQFNFNCGNLIKYIWRAGVKGEAGIGLLQKELEDLNKAKFYLEDEIKRTDDLSESDVYMNIHNSTGEKFESYREKVYPHITENRKGIMEALWTASFKSSQRGKQHLIRAATFLNLEIQDIEKLINENASK
jgi:hypothetical protein